MKLLLHLIDTLGQIAELSLLYYCLREYYTTKPFAPIWVVERVSDICVYEGWVSDFCGWAEVEGGFGPTAGRGPAGLPILDGSLDDGRPC